MHQTSPTKTNNNNNLEIMRSTYIHRNYQTNGFKINIKWEQMQQDLQLMRITYCNIIKFV